MPIRRIGLRARVLVFLAVALAASSEQAAAAAEERPVFVLQGITTDPVGGALAGAVIVARELETEEATSATCDQRGRYRLALPRGRYLVEASSEFFQARTTEILLEADETLNLRLQVSRVYHSVNVVERSPGELLSVPGGIAEIATRDIEEAGYGSIAEVLALQPGVSARSRFGADEVQFSVRGSGLRNNFHMRGINLLFNGRPYMDADGFGDFESLDLMATERIELWKGANALRFGGNQAGGAINFVTPTGATASELAVQARGGSFGLFKAQVASGGTKGPFSYYASFGATDADGYRDYSAQGRRRFFSNLEWELNPSTDLRLDLIYANVSEELPGSLTREEFDSDPRQANSDNRQNRYGRDYDFVHVGLALDHRLSDRDVIAVSVHGHVRDVIHPIFQILDQYQSTLGADFAYRHTGDRRRLLIGISPQGGGNEETRFQNLGGERGELTADFETDVVNLGIYGELQYDVTPELMLVTGGRFDSSRREFTDLFPQDGDRSDRRTFEALSPKVGVLWEPSPGVQLFGNASRSYEPPLLLELTSFGDDVGFIDLEAQDTWQFEIGTRGTSRRVSWEVAVFDWEVENEIINLNVQPFPFAPFTIPTYRNVKNSRHLGLEVGAGMRFGDFEWRNAYTWSDFTFRDDPDYGNNDLPGAPENVLYTELRYEHDSGFWVAPNVDLSLSSYYVDSANTTRNDRFIVLGLKAGYPIGRLDLMLDASNLADEIYSGSVQVDDALGRYFEPSNGRSFFVGLGWRRE